MDKNETGAGSSRVGRPTRWIRKVQRFLSDFLPVYYAEEHCPTCDSTERVQWYDKGEKDYEGWVWCKVCGTKYWSGFVDRVFG